MPSCQGHTMQRAGHSAEYPSGGENYRSCDKLTAMLTRSIGASGEQLGTAAALRHDSPLLLCGAPPHVKRFRSGCCQHNSSCVRRRGSAPG